MVPFLDSFLQQSKCRILTQKALKCKNYAMCREKDKDGGQRKEARRRVMT
jgi:hypothetical protein